MDIAKLIDDNPWILNIFNSIIVVVISLIIYIYISHLIDKTLEKRNHRLLSNKKTKTFIRLLKSIFRYIYIIIIFFIILKINGIDISSMVAGVGVVGIIFSFSIQDMLKDIVKGFDIIADSYYQVGDIIRVNKYTGKVLAIGIKTTKIEDIYEKNIVSISNRLVDSVEVISHMINIDIPLPYDLKLSDAEKVIKYIKEKIEENEKVENVEYRGVNQFADSSIKYQIKVYSEPIDKVQVRRDSLTCIIKCLEEKNISIPFNQIDVHQK